jgi:hypothetical protein
MTAPDRLAKTLIKTLANRGRPHMTKPKDALVASLFLMDRPHVTAKGNPP